jgi:hypothetical protein
MEIPECPLPEHAGSRVVRDGWYGKPSHRGERIYLAGGRPTNQRPHDDPKGVFSLFL